VRQLIAAFSAFDHDPCEHPREWRIFRRQDETEECGFCGTRLPIDPAVSDPST
jgi:hypothetical protein